MFWTRTSVGANVYIKLVGVARHLTLLSVNVRNESEGVIVWLEILIKTGEKAGGVLSDRISALLQRLLSKNVR